MGELVRVHDGATDHGTQQPTLLAPSHCGTGATHPFYAELSFSCPGNSARIDIVKEIATLLEHPTAKSCKINVQRFDNKRAMSYPRLDFAIYREGDRIYVSMWQATCKTTRHKGPVYIKINDSDPNQQNDIWLNANSLNGMTPAHERYFLRRFACNETMAPSFTFWNPRGDALLTILCAPHIWHDDPFGDDIQRIHKHSVCNVLNVDPLSTLPMCEVVAQVDPTGWTCSEYYNDGKTHSCWIPNDIAMVYKVALGQQHYVLRLHSTMAAEACVIQHIGNGVHIATLCTDDMPDAENIMSIVDRAGLSLVPCFDDSNAIQPQTCMPPELHQHSFFVWVPHDETVQIATCGNVINVPAGRARGIVSQGFQSVELGFQNNRAVVAIKLISNIAPGATCLMGRIKQYQANVKKKRKLEERQIKQNRLTRETDLVTSQIHEQLGPKEANINRDLHRLQNANILNDEELTKQEIELARLQRYRDELNDTATSDSSDSESE